ncbi:hypothetical protein L228DRAFT_262713 [Xylona heveae TC161]|uniref:Uncharacterized protein n=1 Tax=Xylona heveae (strain CBS 132557 / TC161) TaxID=1328760 RepID=A0A165FCN2_XYLHT|nr:hypothetical protein L228DRAFT_262713 [Xylona heveae TC161]KZF20826.1 hypothetical protein L228DRAFT_262713 [Xylona heveae TC161]
MSKNRNITDFFKTKNDGRSRRDPQDTKTISSFGERSSSGVSFSQDAPSALNGTFRMPPVVEDDFELEKRNAVKEEKLSSNGPFFASQSSDSMPKREHSPSSQMGSIPPSQELPSDTQTRGMRGGKVFVKSSDDEDSDLESLEDIDNILSRNKDKPLGVKEEQSPALKSRLRSGGLRFGRGTNDHSPRIIPKYKFSLDSLVRQTEEDQVTEAKVASARAAMDLAFASKPAVAAVARHAGGIDESLLYSLVSEGGDEGHVERVLHAMGRTGALNREAVWYFFGPRNASQPLESQPFPQTESPNRWEAILRDPTSRQQAFLSGFAREMAVLRGLSNEVILWLLNEVCIERREDLRYSYAMTLQACGGQFSAAVEPAAINGSLTKLEALEDALDLTCLAAPFHRPTAAPDRDFSRLHSLIEIFGGLSESLSLELRKHTLCLLFRLTLDSNVAYDCNILSIISDAIVLLFDDAPDHEAGDLLVCVGNTVMGFVRDPSLRFQLLDAIPNSSPRVNLFRRRLAFAFFFEDSSYLNRNRDDIFQIPEVIKHLDTAAFTINRGTDYVQLSALISILNIGIDRGVSAPALSSKEQERTFNADVDALAAKIKFMFSSIVDAGATNMTRTIAKEILERLHYRLSYSVRTRPKPKKSIFGAVIDDDGDSPGGGQANFMSRFLQQRQVTDAAQEN